MMALLVIFLVIDALIALYLYKEAFLVRSNMNAKYKVRFALLLAVVIASVLLIGVHLPLACLIAGIPAFLVGLFVIAMAVAMLTHKGPWR